MSRSDRSPPAHDDDLLDRFRRGDRAAFDEIVGRYQERLVHFFYRLCWDRDAAEDFTQTLFLKLLRGSGSYRPEGKLSTFIFRVATNLWIDHYRSTRPRQRLYSLDQIVVGRHGEPSGDEESPAERVERDEERARLRVALEQLSEPHRLVFELAVYQQLPYAEIGRVLAIPVGTVKSRMHNSIRALKAILADAEGGGGDAGDSEQPFPPRGPAAIVSRASTA